MSNQQENEERAEQRRKRRKQERMKALAIAGGAVFVVILILALVIGGLVKTFTKSGKKETQTAQATETKETAEKQEEKKPEEKESKETKPEKSEVAEVSENDADTQQEEVKEEEPSVTEEADEPKEEKTTESLWADDEEDAELSAQIDAEIAEMTTEQKVAKLFMVSPGQLIGTELEPKDVGSKFSEMMSSYPVGGILLKKDNIGTAEEFNSMISNLKSMMSQSVILAIEEEGGEESPFVVRGVTENVIASPKEIGESLGNAGAYSAGISIGSELRNYGIKLNLAPTVDVAESASSFAATNGFGQDMDTNAELGKNMIRGMKDQGILSCVKSFPGYGDVTSDGSKGQVVSSKNKEQLLAASKPYQEAIKAGADMVMISHVGLPKIRGDQRPASISKEVITDIVRDEWGYDGVVITDYMDKNCIYTKYTYAESAAGAIEAGADMILSVKNFQKSYNGVLDAVKKGTISEERLNESVKRVLKLGYRAAY